MYQSNDMAIYMLYFFRIKASVNIFNLKLKMPPTKSILDLKDSHQQSMLSSYLPSKRLRTNDEEKKNNSKISFRTSYTI